MKVLGIDPGSRITGYGVVELLGNKLKFIDSGIIRTKEKTFIKRLMIIFNEIDVVFDKPLVLERGEMQYLYDDKNNKYIDLLGNNLTVSVGHSHPKVVKAAEDQMKKLSHCTTMYYHEEPASLAKELVERLPPF